MTPSGAGVFLRGMLMGAADIVPGVSGGTMAFITGIYDTLVDSIRAVDLEFLRRVLRFDIAGAWRHINGNFLLLLLLGIFTSIFTLARLISWLLENHPVPLWAKELVKLGKQNRDIEGARHAWEFLSRHRLQTQPQEEQ